MQFMSEDLQKLIERLNDVIHSEDFIDAAEEIMDELGQRADSIEAVEPILKLMENHPEADYGTPGPLVHFLEQFYQNGYEERLVESLERRPTKHTLWMLNRIINGINVEQKQYYVGVLERVMAFPGLEQDVKEQAQHFYSLHVN